MQSLSSRIVYELSREPEGLTNAEILQAIGDKKLTHQTLWYYLRNLMDDKVISKRGTIYKLLRKTFIVKGSAVVEFEDKLLFLDCPYYGNDCKLCVNNYMNGDDCKFLEDCPDFVKEKFLKVCSNTFPPSKEGGF